MHVLLARQAAVAVLSVCTAIAPVHAARITVDFEDPGLVSLYFPGDSFEQYGFTLRADFEFGSVDNAGALGPQAPTGNATTFYFNSNVGRLNVQHSLGAPFSLLGFSAAFVPLSPPATPAQRTVLVAYAETMPGDVAYNLFSLGDTSVAGGAPFYSYGDPLDFAAFTNLASLEFFACALTSASTCVAPTNNNGQFAIDDIQLRVHEPTAGALSLLALAALAAGRQRRGR